MWRPSSVALCRRIWVSNRPSRFAGAYDFALSPTSAIWHMHRTPPTLRWGRCSIVRVFSGTHNAAVEQRSPSVNTALGRST